MLNIHGDDGGYAPIAPGPLDSCRGRGRRIAITRSRSEPKRVEHTHVVLAVPVVISSPGSSITSSGSSSATSSPSHTPKKSLIL